MLYALEQSREEGFDKGLVVAATGIGKTYLAAFDYNYKSPLDLELTPGATIGLMNKTLCK